MSEENIKIVIDEIDLEKKVIEDLSKNINLLSKLKHNEDIIKRFIRAGFVGIDFRDFSKYWQESIDCIFHTYEYESFQEFYEMFDVVSLNDEHKHAFVIVFDIFRVVYTLDDYKKFIDKLDLEKPNLWFECNAVSKTDEDQILNNKLLVHHIELIS
jgi:hypothetical protein